MGLLGLWGVGVGKKKHHGPSTGEPLLKGLEFSAILPKGRWAS